MTDEIMNLRTLLEKSSDADLLREMIGFTAQRLMELEVEGKTGAAYGERAPSGLSSAMATARRPFGSKFGGIESRGPITWLIPMSTLGNCTSREAWLWPVAARSQVIWLKAAGKATLSKCAGCS